MCGNANIQKWIIIGLPYFQDTKEKEKVSEYMSTKNKEYKDYREKK
jgi:hypothetical protein